MNEVEIFENSIILTNYLHVAQRRGISMLLGNWLLKNLESEQAKWQEKYSYFWSLNSLKLNKLKRI